MRRVYDQLLAVRGGEASGEELHAPQLRLRLLQSLRRLLAAGRAAAARAPALALRRPAPPGRAARGVRQSHSMIYPCQRASCSVENVRHGESENSQ